MVEHIGNYVITGVTLSLCERIAFCETDVEPSRAERVNAIHWHSVFKYTVVHNTYDI